VPVSRRIEKKGRYNMFDMKREESLLHPDWPEIKWNISGMINYRPLVSFLVQMMRNNGISHVLDSFHDSPDLLWNGGRVNAGVKNYPDSEEYFKTLNKLGIGAYLTFSNAILEKKHLSDEESNRLLDCLDEKCGLNGVIVVNNLMADYIRKKKPGLKLICSVVKAFIENPNGDIAWYKEMQKRFDRVVIHTDHMFDLDLLDKLDRNKAEILITEECIYKCPNRAHHQTLNSVYNIAQFEDKAKADEVFEQIKKIRETSCAGGARILDKERNINSRRSCFLTHEEVKTIYDMGFRKFKISGRRGTIYGLAWNVLNFVFNPDLSYTFARILYSRIDQKVKTEFTEVAKKKGVI
jgi:hypothetical protein